MSPQVKIIGGTHAIAELSPEDRTAFIATLKAHGVNQLDTASRYEGSEAALGQVASISSFTIDTKAATGNLSKEAVLATAQKSLSDLNVASVSTYYLHAPDYKTPIEETLSAINTLHAAGQISAFGLSNFLPDDVEKIHALATAKGWLVPTVYQGNYNPVARHVEETLIPLLRRLGMAFAAYSPLAGGLFAKDPDALVAGTEGGRFAADTRGGHMYNQLYNKPSIVAALREWRRIAADAGIGSTELALRWMRHHSALDAALGDAIIIGSSRPSQLDASLNMLEAGPLEKGIADRASGIWEGVREDAPLDNWHNFVKQAMGA